MTKVSDILWETYNAVLWVAFGLFALFVIAISHSGPGRH